MTTYVLLALQIIIGAVFIILGALRDGRTYIVIAVLGAISTVTGGILALMKGQGLPNRLRQARGQMRNVVFEAEELYWDFRSGRQIIYSDIKKIGLSEGDGGDAKESSRYLDECNVADGRAAAREDWKDCMTVSEGSGAVLNGSGSSDQRPSRYL